jgi:membrane-associated phospholipid phosphatase
VVWLLAFHTGWGPRADLDGLKELATTPTTEERALAERLARLCNPLPYALLSAVVLVASYRSRGLRGLLVALAVLAGANVLAQLLKEALASPRPSPFGQVEDASWPSGHSTAATALALCAVLATRPPLRPVAAVLGAVFVVAVSGSVVLLDWHFPSDALGGYAVGGMVTAVVVAASRLDRHAVGQLGLELDRQPSGHP